MSSWSCIFVHDHRYLYKGNKMLALWYRPVYQFKWLEARPMGNLKLPDDIQVVKQLALNHMLAVHEKQRDEVYTPDQYNFVIDDMSPVHQQLTGERFSITLTILGVPDIWVFKLDWSSRSEEHTSELQS